jgi:outer membrane immunogenic protein
MINKKYGPLLVSPLGLIPALQPADAADLRTPVKAQPVPVTAAFVPIWAGAYIGVHVGVISDQSKATNQLPTLGGGATNYNWALNPLFSNKQTATGILGGGQIGYNFQWNNVVVGVEADIGGSSAKKSTSATAINGINTYTWTAITGIEAFGTARARLGYAFDRTLIFATGGLAFAKLRNTFQHAAGYTWSDNGGWRTGYTVGGGFEYAFARNWSFKAEGLYYDLGRKSHLSVDGPPISSAAGLSDKTTGVVGRVGLNYLFR